MSAAGRLRRHDVLEEVVAGAALVVLTGAVAWGVVTRYVTAQPAAWTGEIAGMAFAWVVFVGAAAAFKRHMHASVDLLVRRLPPPLRRPLQRLVDLGVIGLGAAVVWLSLLLAAANWDNPSPVLRWPLTVTYLSVTVGFASITLRQAGRLLRPDATGAAA